MSLLVADALNFLFSCSLLGGIITVLVLAKATPQVPATEGARYLNGSALTAELISPNISQLDSPICRRSNLRAFCIVSIVDTVIYTTMLAVVLYWSVCSTLAWRRLKEWRLKRAYDLDSLRMRIRLRARMAQQQPATAHQIWVAPEHRLQERLVRPTYRQPDTKVLERSRIRAEAMCYWYMLSRFVLALSYMSYDFRNQACPAMAPILWKGAIAVLCAVLFQPVWQIAFSNRRGPRNHQKSGDVRPTPGLHDEEGRIPLRPNVPYGLGITVVAYVPSEEWLAKPRKLLPFPPRVIVDAGTASPGEGEDEGPVCAVCFEEFQPPLQLPTGSGFGLPVRPRAFQRCLRRKVSEGIWTAEPLWEMPCGHCFHEACAAEWLAACVGPKRCPMCNQNAAPR